MLFQCDFKLIIVCVLVLETDGVNPVLHLTQNFVVFTCGEEQFAVWLIFCQFCENQAGCLERQYFNALDESEQSCGASEPVEVEMEVLLRQHIWEVLCVIYHFHADFFCEFFSSFLTSGLDERHFLRVLFKMKHATKAVVTA